MSEQSKTPPRPPLVTAAAWMIMVGSVFVVLVVWDRIAALHSLDTRKALEPLVDDRRMKDAGIELNDMLAVIRIVSMVAAGCATAMAVLGYQTLQRSRGARLALTVLAVPLFISGLATGGYVLSSVVALAVGTLWLGSARLWFDGKTVPEVPRRTARTGQPANRPVWPPPFDPGQPSGPTPPPADQSPPSTPWPPTAPAPWAPPPTSRYGVPPAAAERARPPALVWACVLTWIFTALAGAVFVTSVVVLAQNPDLVLDKMHEQNPDLASQGVSDHLILVVCYVTCIALAIWSVVAAVLAVLAFRRRRLALYALLVSAAGAAVFCLLGVLGSLIVLVPLAATLVTIGCLVRPDVRAWFDGSAGQVDPGQSS